MPFIAEGKTNLKYILIIVVLSVIVGGGVYLFSKGEVQLPEIQPPEILQPTTELLTSCNTNADCEKYIVYNQCKAYCANKDEANLKIIENLEKTITCDPTLWDPPFIGCECVNNRCVFEGVEVPGVKSEIILKVPVIEYKEPGNVLSEPVIKGYNDKVIKVGEEFIVDPATLGYLIGSHVGDIKLRLARVSDNSVTVDILADEQFDGKFHPRDKIEKEEIKTGTCIIAFPLVLDVFFKYCFEVSKSDSIVILKYRIEEESTMPLP